MIVVGSTFQAWKITWVKSQRYLLQMQTNITKVKHNIWIWKRAGEDDTVLGSEVVWNWRQTVYFGMSFRKMQWDSGQEKCVQRVEGSIFFSLTRHSRVSQMNCYCWVLQITTPSRTQLLAQRADLISVLFALPFTGSWTSSQTGLEGKGHNRENSSREHVLTQHAQRLPGKFESPPPSFVTTTTPSSPDS